MKEDLETEEGVHCCAKCENFGHFPKSETQPYDQYFCNENGFDGVENREQLYCDRDCENYSDSSY